jgi:hypothetical protein
MSNSEDKQMETKLSNLDSLGESLEQYGKTSFELARLLAVKKTASVISITVPSVLFVLISSLVILSLTIGMSLYLGQLLGSSWMGFFCMAGFYALAGILIYFFFSVRISERINKVVITNLLN